MAQYRLALTTGWMNQQVLWSSDRVEGIYSGTAPVLQCPMSLYLCGQATNGGNVRLPDLVVLAGPGIPTLSAIYTPLGCSS